MPRYVQDDPSRAGVLDESMADRAADKLGGNTLREVLPEHVVNVPSIRHRRRDHRGGCRDGSYEGAHLGNLDGALTGSLPHHACSPRR